MPAVVQRAVRRFTTVAGVALICVSALPIQAQPSPPAAATANTPMPYKTVAEALAAFKAQDGDSVTLTHSEGWIIVNEPAAAAQWSFTPDDHPAHPAAVRRIIHRSPQGPVSVETALLCEAPQPACDKLRADFDALNERIRQAAGARQRIAPPMPAPASVPTP